MICEHLWGGWMSKAAGGQSPTSQKIKEKVHIQKFDRKQK